MTALERYIDDLVNDREPEEYGAFPKNESSWEELYELCTRLIAEIVTLRRAAAQPSVQADFAPRGGALLEPKGSHKTNPFTAQDEPQNR